MKSQKICRKTCQEINEQDERDDNLQQSSKHEEIERLKFFTCKHLPQHKLCVLQIMQEHSMNVNTS